MTVRSCRSQGAVEITINPQGILEQPARRARRAKVIDEHAAVFILQGALDRLGRGTMSH
jgi:RNase H-fold protein (predicted Holliday junction resolvase)